MKIIAFATLRNELSAGMLETFFKSYGVCDYVYIYDDASDDGSQEYYTQFPHCTVVQGKKRNFNLYVDNKRKLLERLLGDHPDVDWIVWGDGDTVLDARLTDNHGEGLRELCAQQVKSTCNCILLKHYNLYRSDVLYRIDGKWHSLYNPVIWRNTGDLFFPTIKGSHIHRSNIPRSREQRKLQNKRILSEFAQIHLGTSTDAAIIKHLSYPEYRRFAAVHRSMYNERSIKLKRIPDEMLPGWLPRIRTQIPTTPILDILKQKKLL